MPYNELKVGQTVHLAPRSAMPDARSPDYKIEALLSLDGAALYKIKSETEPFDRVVAPSDISIRR